MMNADLNFFKIKMKLSQKTQQMETSQQVHLSAVYNKSKTITVIVIIHVLPKISFFVF